MKIRENTKHNYQEHLLICPFCVTKLQSIVHISAVCKVVHNRICRNFSIGLFWFIPDYSCRSESHIWEGDI